MGIGRIGSLLAFVLLPGWFTSAEAQKVIRKDSFPRDLSTGRIAIIDSVRVGPVRNKFSINELVVDWGNYRAYPPNFASLFRKDQKHEVGLGFQNGVEPAQTEGPTPVTERMAA